MKESYEEGVASHLGLEPYADDGNVMGVASARGTGRLGILSSEILTFVCRPCPVMGKTTRLGSLWRVSKWHGGVVEPSMSENFKRENREILSAPRRKRRGRSANLSEGTAGTHADRKSDDFIVLSTRANKAAAAVAESVEGPHPCQTYLYQILDCSIGQNTRKTPQMYPWYQYPFLHHYCRISGMWSF